MERIVIIDYGAGNVRSVHYAVQRLGATCDISCNPDVIKNATKVIFPGVGHASFAMKNLQKFGLHKVIPQITQPVLGICLGMQLLGTQNEEGNTSCLSVVPHPTLKLQGSPKAIHIGWNLTTLFPSPLTQGLREKEWFYYDHAFAMPSNEMAFAECSYGEPFAAAIQCRNFYGCQFHPEKSSQAGLQLLKNFLSLSRVPPLHKN